MTKRSLCRQMRPDDSVSFDGGRIVVTVREKTGRRTLVTFSVRSDVVVDLPAREPIASNSHPPCKSEIHK